MQTNEGSCDRNDENLSGRQPERPFTTKVLSRNRNKPFQATQYGTMDHHRSVDFALILIRTTVFQVEPLRELEVELDGGTLVGTFESVLDGDVDLGSVECSVTWVDFPLSRLETVEGVAELLLLPSDGWRIGRREMSKSSALNTFSNRMGEQKIGDKNIHVRLRPMSR